MAFMNKGQNKRTAAPANIPAVDNVGDPEIQEILTAQMIAEVEQQIHADAPDPNKRYFIQREVRIDQHNVRRFRVELTPSMCQVRGCSFDGAVQIGFKNGWKSAPLDQPLSNGKTVGQKILELLELHRSNGHMIETSHIMSEDDLAIHKNAASLPKGFLTAA
jgi:hypothetical protein